MAAGLPLGDDGVLIPGTTTFGGKYRVTRIPAGQGENLRGADILEILEGGAVDHIDNVRRIIAGYLEGAFRYSREEAQTLSIFITIYNGVHRQSVEFFAQRYSPSVSEFMDPQKIGLSLNYREWAGQSQIVIPLTAGTRVGELLTVASDEIATDEVIESLRDTPTDGIEERQDLVDLLDRAAEEQRDIAATEREAIEEERTQVQERRETLEVQREDLQEQVLEVEKQGDEQRVQELQETIKEVENEIVEVQAQESQVESREEAVAQREQAAEQAQKTSDEIRQEVAQDIAENRATDPAAETTESPSPFLFPNSRLENGKIVTTYQLLNQNDGQSLSSASSPLMVGRTLLELGSGLLGIGVGEGGDEGNLILISDDELQEIARAPLPVYSLGDLVYDSDNSLIYAVLRRDGDWYLGQFDLGLNPVRSSAVPVLQTTSIYLGDQAVFVTRKDGRISRLSRTDLRSE